MNGLRIEQNHSKMTRRLAQKVNTTDNEQISQGKIVLHGFSFLLLQEAITYVPLLFKG